MITRDGTILPNYTPSIGKKRLPIGKYMPINTWVIRYAWLSREAGAARSLKELHWERMIYFSQEVLFVALL
jgi:hypothetical protein